MQEHESLQAEERAVGPEGPGLRKRLFDSYADELIGATSRYGLGTIGADELIAEVKKILAQLETFSPGGEAENVLSRAQLVIAERLCEEVICESGMEVATRDRIEFESNSSSNRNRDSAISSSNRIDSKYSQAHLECERGSQ